MLINYSDHINKLNDFREGKIQEALKLDHKEIDSSFRFVSGNMNFILGHNNVGKTHFTFYLMLLYSLKHNIRWLVFSSCLLYTSPSPRDGLLSRMPSSA